MKISQKSDKNSTFRTSYETLQRITRLEGFSVQKGLRKDYKDIGVPQVLKKKSGTLKRTKQDSVTQQQFFKISQ